MWAALFSICVATPLAAIDEPLSAVELTRRILEADEQTYTAADVIDTNGLLSHYDAAGFPETDAGQLVVQSESYGPVTYLQGVNTPYLLYARYSNTQRDAVLFARTGTISDPLPNGGSYTVPFGFGAIRTNAVDISVVEGVIVPHVSDNQKQYTMFPLYDVYGGLMAGTDGVGFELRGVLQERYTARLGASVSSIRYVDADQMRRSPVGFFSAGGGIRFPGLFPELIGPNLITAGGYLSVEVRGSNLGGGVSGTPGGFIELERVFYDSPAEGRDYRTDPRPFNHRVHSVYARLNGGIDLNGILGGTPLRFGIAIGYRVNIAGPKIPEHDFKRTELVYVAEEFRADLRQQNERRELRLHGESH